MDERTAFEFCTCSSFITNQLDRIKEPVWHRHTTWAPPSHVQEDGTKVLNFCFFICCCCCFTFPVVVIDCPSDWMLNEDLIGCPATTAISFQSLSFSRRRRHPQVIAPDLSVTNVRTHVPAAVDKYSTWPGRREQQPQQPAKAGDVEWSV